MNLGEINAMFTRVEKLKKEHQFIIDALSKAKSIGITSEQGRIQLLEAKSILIEHLEHEDTFLYPVLRKASSNDDTLKTLIAEDASEIDMVAEMANRFFAKCENNQTDTKYINDFKELFKALLYRIHNEETTIYNEYNRIIS